MQLLANNSELFDVSSEVVALSRTLTHIAEDTDDGSPVPVPFGATDLAAALSLLANLSGETIPVFDSFTSICDAIVSTAWFDVSLAENGLAKAAAGMLSAVKTSPGSPSAGKAMRELLGAADDLTAKHPEPLFTKPASSAVDDVRYSVASHLYVDELVELKSVSVDWKDVARSVLCSMPLCWEPPLAAAVQLWEEVQVARSSANLESLRRMINSMNLFDAASLLTRVAESFFAHLPEWANVTGSWMPFYIQVFFRLLERSHPDAIAPHMQNIARLCELPCVPRFIRLQKHVLLKETPTRIFDAEAAFFVARRHWFINRCSPAAMRPHMDSLVDVYSTSSDAFRVAILGHASDDVFFRLLSIIAHPEHAFTPNGDPDMGPVPPSKPSKEEVAIYDSICSISNLGASALKDNAIVVMRVLSKLHSGVARFSPPSRMKRIVDTFEQGDIDAFAPSLTFKNDDFFPHFLMRVDDATLASRADDILRAPTSWAPAVPDLLDRLPTTIWSTLYRNIIGEGFISVVYRNVLERIDDDTFTQYIRPLLAEDLRPPDGPRGRSFTAVSFFKALSLSIKKRHVDVIVDSFDLIEHADAKHRALYSVLPDLVSEQHVPFLLQHAQHGGRLRLSAIDCLRKATLLSQTMLHTLFEPFVTAPGPLAKEDVDVVASLVSNIRYSDVQPFEGTLRGFLQQRGSHSALACCKLSSLPSCDDAVLASVRMHLRGSTRYCFSLDNAFVRRNLPTLGGWLSDMKTVWSIELMLGWACFVDCSPIVSEITDLFDHESTRVKSVAIERFRERVSRTVQPEHLDKFVPLIGSDVRAISDRAIRAIAACEGGVSRFSEELRTKAAIRGPVGVAARKALKGVTSRGGR